jgi:hypothetical protein
VASGVGGVRLDQHLGGAAQRGDIVLGLRDLCIVHSIHPRCNGYQRRTVERFETSGPLPTHARADSGVVLLLVDGDPPHLCLEIVGVTPHRTGVEPSGRVLWARGAARTSEREGAHGWPSHGGAGMRHQLLRMLLAGGVDGAPRKGAPTGALTRMYSLHSSDQRRVSPRMSDCRSSSGSCSNAAILTVSSDPPRRPRRRSTAAVHVLGPSSRKQRRREDSAAHDTTTEIFRM